MSNPTNNIPVVEDEDLQANAPSAAVTGNLPGATAKITPGKGSNISVPGANSLNEQQTVDIIERLQKYVDEKDSNKGVINPIMKGLNLAYATTYGPDTLQRAQAQYDLQDKNVQETLNTMGSLSSSLTNNKAFMAAANGAGAAGTSAGPGGPGTMQVQGSQLAPIDVAIKSLPEAMQANAKILKAMGTREAYEKIFADAKDYQMKGRTTESKNAEEIANMPEGPDKNIRLAQNYNNAANPVSTFNGGFKTESSGPLATRLTNPSTATPTSTGPTFLEQAKALNLPIISGIRTPLQQAELRHHRDPKTNEWLTKEGRPVSENSPHLTGDGFDLKPGAVLLPEQKAWLQANTIQPDPRDSNHYQRKPTAPVTGGAPAPTSGGRTPAGIPAGSVEGVKYSTEQLGEQNKMDREAIVKPLREVQEKNLTLPNQISNAIAVLDKTKVGPGTGLKQLLLETKGTFVNLDPKDMKYLSNLRTLDSLGKKIILSDAKGLLPGSFSDSDRAYIDKTGYGINDPKEFIKATMELKKASIFANRDLANYLSKPENSGRIAEAYQQYQDSGKAMEILRQHAPTLFKYEKKENAPTTTATPKYSDDAAREWLAKNPNDPKAAAVRKSLESK